MGGLFRSETMNYIQLVLDEESARETIRAIGGFQLLHIENHGVIDRRLYKDNKRRILECVAWQRKFQDFRTVMRRNGVTPPGPGMERDGNWIPAGDPLDQIQRYFEQMEKDLTIQFNFKLQEMSELNTQLERKYVLLHARDSVIRARDEQQSDEKQETITDGLLEDGITCTINGTIPWGNQNMFERMVYRVAKGRNNALCDFKRIESKVSEPFNNPDTGEPIDKSVFTIIVVGSELPRRIRKICLLFGANIFDVPRSKDELERELAEINKNRIEGLDVLKETNSRITKSLTQLAINQNGGSPLRLWERAIEQEQFICEALQKFYIIESASSEQKSVGGRIAANCWVPEESFGEFKQILRQLKTTMAVVTPLETSRMPPTYFKTNAFTGTCQAIVDTYGIACYKEANPGLFTIITFPFLFGIMYGDVFHGSLITLAALYMLYNEKSLIEDRKRGKMGEIFAMAFAGRYLAISMGLFAIYCGTVYNDCASIPFNIYGSKYVNSTDGSPFLTRISDEPYPYGLDPAWYHKSNSLKFINSMKMKMAVTIGVTQMTFGIILGLTNDIYHSDRLSIAFEFLPRIFFMLCTFGYMIFMIIFKFFVDWTGKDSPNLIQTMIKMFLSPGHWPEVPLYDAQTQCYVQTTFVIIAVICLPLMMFPKSLIKHQIWKQRYGHLHQQHSLNEGKAVEQHGSTDHDAPGGHDHRTVGPNFDIWEDLITTNIHTIEFVLGCVSNTASYLRLWALSLAHAELSEVFWQKMIMDYGLLMMPLGFVGMAIWIVATVCVLLCMDVLECFLHALRLHWVEFQNKFYQGEGYQFKPFKLSSGDD